jgi:outer membrane protein
MRRRKEQMKYTLNLFLGTTGLILGGCVSKTKSMSSDPEHLWRPVQINESRVDISKPLFSSNGSYSLAALVELGISNNPQTRNAWWQAKKALAQQGRAEAPYFPNLTARIDATKQQTGAVLGNPMSRIESWGPSLNITYRLFQFGTHRADAKSAACALAAANYKFNHVLQSVVCDIQKNYYNYTSAVATIEARESSLKDASASFDAVENRQKHGLARTQDVLLAKADKLQAAYELQAAQAQLENCRAELALSVGIPVSKDFEVQVDIKESKPLTEKVEVLLNQTLKRRSDILAAEASVHAADWGHLKTQREALPAVDFTGSMGALRYHHDARWQNNYNLGIGVSWNIFNGFDTQYKALADYANVKSQQFALHQQQLQALRDVWTEFHTFQSFVQLLDSAKALETAASESFEAIRIGYDAGLNSLLDLLSAQKTLAAARLKRIHSQTELAIHWVQLAYVSGRLELRDNL